MQESAEPHALVDIVPELAERLQRDFEGRLNVHAIVAPNYAVTIVEAFAAGADKLAGVTYVAQARRIPPSGIVAVGDDVNDIPMVRGAGLGVAMPHATDELARIARRVVVAHPGHLRLIFRSKRKNDRVDARKLATLLFLDQVPRVHVPRAAVRDRIRR